MIVDVNCDLTSLQVWPRHSEQVYCQASTVEGLKDYDIRVERY